MLIFINNNCILVKLFKKKAKITVSFFMKNSKNNNIFGGVYFLFFSFMYIIGFSLSNE